MVRRRRRPVTRITTFSLSKLFPNVVTLLGLCAGLFALKYAMQGRWEMSVGFVVIAAFIDGVDGRLARLLNATSNFGAQLDSLSDFFNFGVAPALIIYLWIGHEIKGIGWALSLFFIICAALRLARFNAELEGPEDKADPALYEVRKKFFTGVPAPSGAGMCLLPMIVSFLFADTAKFSQIPLQISDYPGWVIAYMALIAVLMVSRIPTVSVKELKISREFASVVVALVVLFVLAMVVEPWAALSLMGLGYLLLMPVTLWRYFLLRRRALTRQSGNA